MVLPKSTASPVFCEDYTQTFERAQAGHVIYCDPPYAPLSTTANFTGYAGHSFNLDEQMRLAQLAQQTAHCKNLPVLAE